MQYQAPSGNKINKYCLIEQNGLLVDYSYDTETVNQRLYENGITLRDDSDLVSTSSEVDKIVEVVASEISHLYGDYS